MHLFKALRYAAGTYAAPGLKDIRLSAIRICITYSRFQERIDPKWVDYFWNSAGLLSKLNPCNVDGVRVAEVVMRPVVGRMI